MPIYRAVPKQDHVEGQTKQRHAGRRLPANIPYLVDNLWELARPDGLPSRRHAVYASPTPELALQNACAAGLARDNYLVCRLEFDAAPPMIQLSVADARLHGDVANLQREVNRLLGRRADDSLADKLALAPLFLPGIGKQELRAAMDADPALDALARAAAAQVTLWSDRAAADGEFFFEIAPENTYRLFRI